MNESMTLTKGRRFDFTPESLPEHPLFEGLALDFRKILADCAMRADFEAGQEVVQAGQPANGFYLVARGEIDLESPATHSLARVQTIGQGDILGWSWLFPPYYWHFNAVAKRSTQTVFFYGSRLRQQCDRNHDFGYELIKNMSRILITNLRGDRERWIEAAHVTPIATGGLSDYLII